jgi:hypothetical protein
MIFKINQIIPLNEDLFNLFMTNDKDSLEELRAEIIGLYIMTHEIDILNKNQLYKDWYKKLGKEKMLKECIINFCKTALSKLRSQPSNFKNILAPHTRANIVILNYLLTNNCIEIKSSNIIIESKKYKVYNIILINMNKTLNNIKELMIKVQKISSTANNTDNLKLFNKYTQYPLTIKKMNRIRNNLIKKNKKLSNGLTMSVRLLPKFIPIYDMFGNLIDVQVSYYDSIIEQEEDIN